MSRDGVRAVVRSLVHFLVVAGLSVFASSSLRAQKTDVIVLQNGDRVTGEILKLQRGRLIVDTAQAGGKVNIRWRYIVDLESDKVFEIRLGGGEFLLGGFGPAPGDSLIQITLPDSIVLLDRFEIVLIEPVKQGFWARWEGSLSAGLTFLQAGDQTDYDLAWESTYRGPTQNLRLTANSFFRTRAETENTYRNDLRALYRKIYPKNWFAFGVWGVQQNSDLDLDLRSAVGGGGGRTLFANHEMNVGMWGGAVYTRESYSNVDESGNSLEGLFASNFSAFILGGLDTELNVETWVLPSLTERGRVRIQINAEAKRELFSDFFLRAAFYNDYDSDPLNPESANNDATASLSLGWSFY